ncbi:MAG: hypothetical protein IVW57_01040 [Ktedonobacterales bacterium]|nr:hypothetical protein [Ktedonobacterales bacterium]
MGRRGHGEGSIHKRVSDERWVGVLDLGYANGKRQRTLTGFADGNPKTRSGRWRILLTPLAVQVLHAHRQRQLEECLALGPVWQETDIVFASAVGTPLDPNNIIKQFYGIAARAAHPLP